MRPGTRCTRSIRNAAQPFHLAGYPIFLAEIASTVNEVLLTWHLLGTDEGKDPGRPLRLLNRFVDGFEGTIVNQAMYADFELRTHSAAEAGQPLTLEFLNEQFGEVQGTYAPGVVVDDRPAIHWARVPHFYRAFYVFQYATGLVCRDQYRAGGARRGRAGPGSLPGPCWRRAARTTR